MQVSLSQFYFLKKREEEEESGQIAHMPPAALYARKKICAPMAKLLLQSG